MKNKNKQAIIVVIMFLVLIIAVLVILGFNKNEKANIEKSEEKLNTMNSLLKNQLEQNYNNRKLYASEVKSAIQQYISNVDVTIVLMKSDNKTILATAGAKKISQNTVTLKNTVFEITKKDLLAEGGSYHHTSATDFNSDEYIKYNKKYNSYLLKLAETNETVGIVFVADN